MKLLNLAALALSIVAPLSAQAVSGSVEAGKALYQARCAACHSLDYNGVGPAHRGVFGRQAGQAPGYLNYSPALRGSRQVWNEATLDSWLKDPERFAPGQRMGVSVPDEQDRAHLITYLKAATSK